MHVLAVDIGGTQYRMALVDEEGNILDHCRQATDREQGASWLLPRIAEEARRIASQHGEKPAALGIGFGGPVDFGQQSVIRSMHAPGWEHFHLSQWLGNQIGVRAVMDNDGNVGAWGEYRFGAGAGASEMVYYTVSTGVGGGFVTGDRLYRGWRQRAGELGHVPIAMDGPTCSCGQRGCLEAFVSGPAIAAAAEFQLERSDADSGLTTVLERRGRLTAEDVFSAAQSGDRLAGHVVDEAREAFRRSVWGVVSVLDPEIVVVGGGVGLAPGFLQGTEQWVNEHAVVSEEEPVRVVPAALGDHSVLLGAAALAWEIVEQGSMGGPR